MQEWTKQSIRNIQFETYHQMKQEKKKENKKKNNNTDGKNLLHYQKYFHIQRTSRQPEAKDSAVSHFQVFDVSLYYKQFDPERQSEKQ